MSGNDDDCKQIKAKTSVTNESDGCSQAIFYLKEIEKHKSEKDLWIIYDDQVFDISNWHSKHPGGDRVLLNMGGKDCTDVFDAFHPVEVKKQMKCECF